MRRAVRGSEFQVNAYTTGTQWGPSVSVASEGDFVVVWRSGGSDGTDTDLGSIQGQRYSSDGTARGMEFQINADTRGDQTSPSVGVSDDGSLFVAWMNRIDTDESRSIQGQRYASDGTERGAQFQINTSSPRHLWDPSVTADAAGGYVVVWGDFLSRIQGQWFTSEGSRRGGEFQIDTATASGTGPAVDASPDGGFVAVWAGHSFGTDTDGGSIQGRRFSGGGGAPGEPFVCVEDSTTFCLNGGRYEVKASWRDHQGQTGKGQVVPGASSNSGLFWFFGASNWEMLVKVLDACTVNERYWVFAAATTDVEYTLSVRDSFTGFGVSYFNPLGTSSPAVTDTQAFSTCP